MKKWLESEAGRNNSQEKIQDLLVLRDTLFRSRFEKYHWDIDMCLESRSRLYDCVFDLPELEQERPLDDSETTIIPPSLSLMAGVMGGSVTGMSDYSYDMNTSIVVSDEDRDDDKAVWIGNLLTF